MALTKEEKRKRGNKATRRWRAENPEKMKAILHAWYLKNTEKVKKQTRDWHAANPERSKSTSAEYRKRNKEKIQARNTKNQKRRYHEDENFRIAHILRARLTSSAIKGSAKAGSFVRDLGCSIPEFRDHLEKQFQPGMVGENHTPYGWHIDHIIPLNTFDLTDRKQFLKAAHYTNSRPLWASENFSRPKNGSDVV